MAALAHTINDIRMRLESQLASNTLNWQVVLNTAKLLDPGVSLKDPAEAFIRATFAARSREIGERISMLMGLLGLHAVQSNSRLEIVGSRSQRSKQAGSDILIISDFRYKPRSGSELAVNARLILYSSNTSGTAPHGLICQQLSSCGDDTGEIELCAYGDLIGFIARDAAILHQSS